MLEASGVNVIKDEVHFTITDNGFRVQGIDFDKLVLASGAWLAKILDEHNYQVDVRPQKGNCETIILAILIQENILL